MHQGRFHCPICGLQTYQQLRVDKWFTLYFVPVFRLSTLGEYVECQHCHRTYETDILQYSPPSMQDMLLTQVLQDLQSGTPIEMATRKLVNHGAPEQEAARILAQLTTEDVLCCSHCRFTYLRTVQKCSSCSGALTAQTAAAGA